MSLFDKYLGFCFKHTSAAKLTPTLGLSFLLHESATGNSVVRRIARTSSPVRTINRSRYLRGQ